MEIKRNNFWTFLNISIGHFLDFFTFKYKARSEIWNVDIKYSNSPVSFLSIFFFFWFSKFSKFCKTSHRRILYHSFEYNLTKISLSVQKKTFKKFNSTRGKVTALFISFLVLRPFSKEQLYVDHQYCSGCNQCIFNRARRKSFKSYFGESSPEEKSHWTIVPLKKVVSHII